MVPSSSALAGVTDGAKLFSDDAVAKATSTITQLEAKTPGKILVETFDGPPADRLDKFKSSTTPGRRDLFQAWARERAAATGTDGLYVLVTKSPKHLEVMYGKAWKAGGFTPALRDSFTKTLLDKFRENDFDGGLNAGMAVLAAGVDAPRKPVAAAAVNGLRPAPSAPPVGSGSNAAPAAESNWLVPLGAIVIVVLAGILAVRVLGALFGGSGAPGGMGGGGGMFGGFMTGLFGAMAGHYIYDSFFGNQAHAGDHMGNSNLADPGQTDVGGSNDFSGGDFGSSDFGGGGDFGGGDF